MINPPRNTNARTHTPPHVGAAGIGSISRDTGVATANLPGNQGSIAASHLSAEVLLSAGILSASESQSQASSRNPKCTGRGRLSPRWNASGRLPPRWVLSASGRNPDVPTVLLSHRPEAFARAAARGVDLQLSGHTHAGQIPPLDLLVWLFYPYSYGYGERGDARIYTTCGTGTWGPRMRLFSRNEFVRITLMPAG